MAKPSAVPNLRLITHAAGISCPVERTIQVIGGRWRLLVLRSLLLDGAQRYNQLLAHVRGISPKELTRNLRTLEGLGLVAHTASGKIARYALTPLGGELGPAFESLIPFGERLSAEWSKKGIVARAS
jgi:DNA-binding HxlR family transcriptional regulator